MRILPLVGVSSVVEPLRPEHLTPTINIINTQLITMIIGFDTLYVPDIFIYTQKYGSKFVAIIINQIRYRAKKSNILKYFFFKISFIFELNKY